MAELSLSLPVKGEEAPGADAKVNAAFTEIQTQFNGKVAAINLEAAAVTESKIEAALREKLGLSRGKSIIATEQERENVAFGTLATPDEVTVTMPENGLIMISYQAQWSESVKNAARAAIFVGATQLKVARPVAAGPGTNEAGTGGSSSAGVFLGLSSFQLGLMSMEASEGVGADVTTGQAVGFQQSFSSGGFYSLAGGAVSSASFAAGGECRVFAAAGTYKISVQFKASAGNVKVKNRKLWVEAKAF